MNRDDSAIPDGWERVPDDQKLQVGDMYWHLWYRKWAEYDLQYGICTAGDYKKHGAIVIRKKESTQ